MRTIAAKATLLVAMLGSATSLSAGDATSALLERLDRGSCDSSSLDEGTWTISSDSVGTHGELNWGDTLEFEPVGQSSGHNNRSAFKVWKNGLSWRSAKGWSGSCVRDGHHSVYVVTGAIQFDGCLHEIAFGRLDHADSLSHRIEVIFEHEAARGFCTDEHRGHEARHPGHSHGDND